MLCQRCVSRLAPAPSRSSALCTFSTSRFTRSPTNLSLAPTSTTFSTPLTSFSRAFSSTSSSSSSQLSVPSPSPAAPPSAPPPPPKSNVKAGTPLRGLGYFKGKENVIAGADEDYPDWLWTLLDGGNQEKGLEKEVEGDLFSKSKKQRRIAAKAAQKAAALDPSLLIPKIPLEQQSIDLPAATLAAPPVSNTVEGDAGNSAAGWNGAQRAREELTHAMRRGRRKGIKEGNFLKGMK